MKFFFKRLVDGRMHSDLKPVFLTLEVESILVAKEENEIVVGTWTRGYRFSFSRVSYINYF